MNFWRRPATDAVGLALDRRIQAARHLLLGQIYKAGPACVFIRLRRGASLEVQDGLVLGAA